MEENYNKNSILPIMPSALQIISDLPGANNKWVYRPISNNQDVLAYGVPSSNLDENGYPLSYLSLYDFGEDPNNWYDFSSHGPITGVNFPWLGALRIVPHVTLPEVQVAAYAPYYTKSSLLQYYRDNFPEELLLQTTGILEQPILKYSESGFLFMPMSNMVGTYKTHTDEEGNLAAKDYFLYPGETDDWYLSLDPEQNLRYVPNDILDNRKKRLYLLRKGALPYVYDGNGRLILNTGWMSDESIKNDLSEEAALEYAYNTTPVETEFDKVLKENLGKPLGTRILNWLKADVGKGIEDAWNKEYKLNMEYMLPADEDDMEYNRAERNQNLLQAAELAALLFGPAIAAAVPFTAPFVPYINAAINGYVLGGNLHNLAFNWNDMTPSERLTSGVFSALVGSPLLKRGTAALGNAIGGQKLGITLSLPLRTAKLATYNKIVNSPLVTPYLRDKLMDHVNNKLLPKMYSTWGATVNPTFPYFNLKDAGYKEIKPLNWSLYLNHTSPIKIGPLFNSVHGVEDKFANPGIIDVPYVETLTVGSVDNPLLIGPEGTAPVGWAEDYNKAASISNK